MENIRLEYLSTGKRFPLPPSGIFYKEADKIYLPPLERKYDIYWMAGIAAIIILAGVGIYYLITKPPTQQAAEEEKRNNIRIAT